MELTFIICADIPFSASEVKALSSSNAWENILHTRAHFHMGSFLQQVFWNLGGEMS